MSLRARLMAGLLSLAAAGLLLLGAITWLEQRSFLNERVDEQARAAVPAVGRALMERGAIERAPRAPGPHTRPLHGGPGPPPGEEVSLPPGTYGEVRSAEGEVLEEVALAFSEETLPAPDLPAQLSEAPVTVGSEGEADLRYRAVAVPVPGGGSIAVAVPLSEVDRTLDRLLLVEALVIAGVLVALAVLAWFLVGLGLRPLERIAGTAGEIAAGRLSQRVSPADGRTEVGRLGLALNAMLGRLESAFSAQRQSEDRLRRFLADASHELRTPLTSIRGYAELFRTGAARDPANTEKAMRRIEDEATRMGVLVEDLLALARLDEVRERVHERVAVAALARDAVDDGRATAPARRFELSADEPLEVLGDPGALRQVVGNLVRNAITHTPEGSPVEVSARRDGDSAVVEVRDHGAGLPAGDAALLFERFWRAEGGRERGRGGAGLGLAIVAGIAEAHGGSVEAANAEGGGARFTVRLPLAPGHGGFEARASRHQPTEEEA